MQEKIKNVRDYLWRIDDALFDPKRSVILRDGKTFELTANAFEMLVCLIESRGYPVTKDDLKKRISRHENVGDNSLSNYIGTLRDALDSGKGSDALLATRRGHGYCLQKAEPEPYAVQQDRPIESEFVKEDRSTKPEPRVSPDNLAPDITSSPPPTDLHAGVSERSFRSRTLLGLVFLGVLVFGLWTVISDIGGIGSNTSTETVSPKRLLADSQSRAWLSRFIEQKSGEEDSDFGPWHSIRKLEKALGHARFEPNRLRPVTSASTIFFQNESPTVQATAQVLQLGLDAIHHNVADARAMKQTLSRYEGPAAERLKASAALLYWYGLREVFEPRQVQNALNTLAPEIHRFFGVDSLEAEALKAQRGALAHALGDSKSAYETLAASFDVLKSASGFWHAARFVGPLGESAMDAEACGDVLPRLTWVENAEHDKSEQGYMTFAWIQARLFRGVCQWRLGDQTAALALLDSVIDDPATPTPPDAKHVAQAFKNEILDVSS